MNFKSHLSALFPRNNKNRLRKIHKLSFPAFLHTVLMCFPSQLAAPSLNFTQTTSSS